MKSLKNKGQASAILAGLATVAILIATLGVTTSVSQDVLQGLADDECTTTNGTQCSFGAGTFTHSYNNTVEGQTGLQNMAQDFGTVGTVVVASALIALVAGGLGALRR